MNSAEYANWVTQLSSLSTAQIKHLKEQITVQCTGSRAALILSEQSPKNCPHCKSPSFNKVGHRNGLQRYKCKSCLKTFNPLTNTPLARLRKKDLWEQFARALVEGESVRAAANKIGVHKNTSFRWRHRFLQNLKGVSPEMLTGIIELVEVYFPYSEKGAKPAKTAHPKSVSVSSPCKKPKEPVCVVLARDRHANTCEATLSKLGAKELTAGIIDRMPKDVLLCSESKPVYLEFTKTNGLRHGRLANGEEVVKDVVHLKNVQLYRLKLNDWMSRFRGVATKYLESYLGWFRNLDEFNMLLPQEELLRRSQASAIYLHQPLKRTKEDLTPTPPS